jgi:hypothetical protein
VTMQTLASSRYVSLYAFLLDEMTLIGVARCTPAMQEFVIRFDGLAYPELVKAGW